jgi:hypothetical protein
VREIRRKDEGSGACVCRGDEAYQALASLYTLILLSIHTGEFRHLQPKARPDRHSFIVAPCSERGQSMGRINMH